MSSTFRLVRSTLRLAPGVLVLLFLLSCASKPADPLVGVWERSHTEGAITFVQRLEVNSDGTMKLHKKAAADFTELSSGRWRRVGSDRVAWDWGQGDEMSEIEILNGQRLKFRQGSTVFDLTRAN